MPIPSPIVYTSEPARNTDGVMRAYTYVNVTDIFGRITRKRVSLGTDWNTELETARDTMERVRANNPNLSVQGDFRVNL